jgi:hypothetical protein
MKHARADHAILYQKGSIYVFGGMSSGNRSLDSCEVYNIKEDKWGVIPKMSTARQSFSACAFNEKYIFVFGGKNL